jgi:hypothetical protein
MPGALIGRHREVLAIERLLSRGAEGRGGVVVLVGPPGAGTTTLADRAADLAVQHGLDVLRATAPASTDVEGVWEQIVLAAGDPGPPVPTDPDGGAASASDAVVRRLSGLARSLLIVDDLAGDDEGAREVLDRLASRVAAGGPSILVTCSVPLGVGVEVDLQPLGPHDLAELCPDLGAVELDAVRLASEGWPGPALAAAAELAAVRPPDPIVHLALLGRSRAGFLEVDDALVALLRAALLRAADDGTRSRLTSRLARELLGDPTAAEERRALTDEARRLARGAHDDGALAEALDARLHAVWDPDGAEARRSAAAEIVQLAVAAGDRERERRGLFWSFVAHMELAEVSDAEAALARYARACASAGDRGGAVMVTARHAMLAALRGRFDDATRLTAAVAREGRRAGLADTDALSSSLRAAIAIERGDPQRLTSTELLSELPRLYPGQQYEATLAFSLAMMDRPADAEAELDRALRDVLRSAGPRSLRAMVELSVVAVAIERRDATLALYERMLPYRGRLVVGGGAAVVLGPMARWLGLLAIALGRDEAVELLEDAAALEERMGALPGLANTHALLAVARDRGLGGPPTGGGGRDRARAEAIGAAVGLSSLLSDRLFRAADEWRLEADGDGWRLEAATERANLPDGPGLRYLRTLVANPRHEIAALDLVAGGPGLAAPPPLPILDARARHDYRRRLLALEEEIDRSDRRGDPVAGARALDERSALLAELERAAGLGGRRRGVSAEGERARVNVTRALRKAIAQIAAVAPTAGAHLESSIRTGAACRYEPAHGGPRRWRV